MNIVSVLLIAGLVYVAMQQKNVSNRNVMLIVTGFLAFCMLGREGFVSITGGDGTDLARDTTLTNPIQVTDSTSLADNLIIYDFPTGFDPTAVTEAANALPSANIPTCTIGGISGEISAMEPWPPAAREMHVTGSNINTFYKCDPVDQGQGCTDYTDCPPTTHLIKTGANLPGTGIPSTTLCCDTKALCSNETTLKCTDPAVKKTGDTALCAGKTCVADDFGDKTTACCRVDTKALCSNETTLKCTDPAVKKTGDTALCAGKTCVADDFGDKTTACCRAPDADESCINAGDDLDSYNDYGDIGKGCSIWNSDEGAKCGTFLWVTQNCDSDDGVSIPMIAGAVVFALAVFIMVAVVSRIGSNL